MNLEPKTYADVLQAIGQVTSGTAASTDDFEVEQWAFRGLPDQAWKSTSTLWRTFSSGFKPNELGVSRKEQLEIARATAWMRTEGLPGGLGELNVLAHLQHHGLPTRLMDLTSNPLTALWFACADTKKNGMIVAIDISKLHAVRTDDTDWKGALRYSASQQEPIVVRPAFRDARMRAQDGFFLASTVPDQPNHDHLLEGMYAPKPWTDGGANMDPAELQDRFDDWNYRIQTVVIPANIKKQIRSILHMSFNKSEASLFPDVAGLVSFVKSLRGGPR